MTSSTTLWTLSMEVVCIIFFWEAWGWLVINKQFFSVELRYYHLQNVVGHVGFQMQMLSIRKSSETFQSKYVLRSCNMGRELRSFWSGWASHTSSKYPCVWIWNCSLYSSYQTGPCIQFHIKPFFVPAWIPVSMKDLVWVILLQANMKMLLVGITALEFPIRG